MPVSYKLIVTVVNKKTARKVVEASKKAGADGGTVIMGRGTGIWEIKTFFGIPIEPDKEIVLTLISGEKTDDVLKAVIIAGKIDKPGYGIAFVIDTKITAGICHARTPAEAINEDLRGMAMEHGILYDLIITIINKGQSEKVVEASKKAGARGGTIISGRGTGVHEHAKLFGITIEPEKEIVLTLIEREKTNEVLQTIVKEAGLDRPGKGIAFVVEVERVAGISHVLNKMVSEKLRRR